jgi:hypothetical protein
MSKIAKSAMTVDGNSVHVSMPFAKVDEAQRLVSGFATLDNIDSQGDVVLSEASRKAFERARGNIREMHQPLAVGRMVDFREDEYYDTNDKKFYRGIFVTARVSEGAEDTWKKVLDGTLTGFSIGGEINDASSEFVKEAGKTVRFIKDYDLVELSLVDNPANQLANVLSIQKTATGSVVKGMAVETQIENVFVCSKHDEDVVTVRETEAENCPMCGAKMENAGWFETGADRTEKVQSIVEKFLNPEMEAAPISNSEGGVVMGVEKNDKVEEKAEVTEPEAVEPEAEEVAGTEETEEETTEEVVETTDEEEAETPEEVTDEGEAISKKIDELHDAVKESLEKTSKETAETVAALEEKVTEATQQFLAKASELDEKMTEFGTKLEASKSRLANLESALEKMNKADAVKKSVDLSDEETVEVVQKDASWNGAFSGKRGGGNSPRFSVDNLM